MSHDFDSEDSDHVTAIAAATFAIYSADESRLRQNQGNNVKEGLKNPMTRANTRKEDPIWLPEPSGVSRRLSHNETKGQGKFHFYFNLKSIIIYSYCMDLVMIY